MLRLIVALMIAGGGGAVRSVTPDEDVIECIDRSHERIRSAKEAPACWADLGKQDIANGQRLEGRIPTIPAELRGARVDEPRVAFKLCINAAGRIAKIYKVASSGNAAVDAFYCRQLCRWRFRPKSVKGVLVPSTEHVTITLYR